MFFPTSSALPLPKCFTTEQNIVEALFMFCRIKGSFISPHSQLSIFKPKCIFFLMKRAKMSQSQSLLELVK